MDSLPFSVRIDKNGLRPVFLLGNELGPCPYHCAFCSVGNSKKVSSKTNIRLFDEQFARYKEMIDGPYHPIIYNRGNATNEKEFSRGALDHILNIFCNDDQTSFVSINSREPDATPEVLDWLAEKHLPFPIHFISGVESFSDKAADVLGKRNEGELERFIQKLKPFNTLEKTGKPNKKYTFGLDVNLVFLPELYLTDGEKREQSLVAIREGIKSDLNGILDLIDSDVPVEINIHPFHRVDALPYEDVDLDLLMEILPLLQETVDRHNVENEKSQTHLFIGIEGIGYDNERQIQQIAKWKSVIDTFNKTGSLATSQA